MPVFFESGLLILIPVAFGIARKTGKSVFCYSIPLLAGLAIGHAFVPPTPGPVLVAEMLNVELSYVIILGIIIGIPAMILAGPVFGKFAGNNIPFMKPAQLVVAFLVAAAVRVSVGSATESMTMLSKSLFEVDEKTNLKTWTVMETIVGLVGIVGATIVWFIVS